MDDFGRARDGGGVPLTEEERKQRHYEQYGTYEVPSRGTGLQSIGILKGLTNPEGMNRADIWGMILGASLGWYLSSRYPNLIMKYVGVVVGAELGILVSRLVGKR